MIMVSPENKIRTIDELKDISKNLKKEGKKIVLCHGCFDVVHYGHIQHFKEAKNYGDVLMVTLTPDKFIQKGPGRPIFNENVRISHLAEMSCIDYLALNQWPTAVETIEKIKPDVYAKGGDTVKENELNDGSSKISLEKEAISSIGGKLIFTGEIKFNGVTLSSSNIINELGINISKETRIFIADFKKEADSKTLLKLMEDLKDIKVLLIGDAIIDAYAYCDQLDIASKEPLIAYRFDNMEVYLGGIFAAAKHLVGFTKNISLVSCIGKNYKNFIEKELDKDIDKNIFVQKESSTLIKKRYINAYKRMKLFEVYNDYGVYLNEETEKKVLDYLKNNLSKFDLVVITDFGHGFMTKKIIDFLTKSDKFLAITCQLNAGNLRSNFITKYKRADFISINENEIRSAFQERWSDIKIPIKKLSDKLNVKKINITLGKYGSIFYDNGNFFKVPSFNKNPLDTIGAGDAVLSLTSLLAYKNANYKTIPFLGNCMGALAVNIIGNKEAVQRSELNSFVTNILS